MNILSHIHVPFRWFVAAFFCAILIPMGIRDGMFMDGLIYASVSHNLADGIGTFWFPTFSKTFLTDYHEQLPLFFGIQALWFKVLGDSIYVERLFSLVLAVVIALLIRANWRQQFADHPAIRAYGWLPIWLWVSIPIVFTHTPNNLQELLMTPQALAAVWSIWRGLTGSKTWLFLALGGVFIFLASFCKGPQGLFPLVTVGAYWLCFRGLSLPKAILYSLFLLLVPTAIYYLLTLHPTSAASLLAWYDNRIVRTFTLYEPGLVDASSRLHLLWSLIEQLLQGIFLVSIPFMIYRVRIRTGLGQQFHYKALFFLLIGLSGTLPLMVTLEQRAYYLCTPLPFCAIALAIWGVPYAQAVFSRTNVASKGWQWFGRVAMGLFAGVLIFSAFQVGGYRKNESVIRDVHTIGAEVPKGEILTVSLKTRQNYELNGYFVRHYYLSLDPGPEQHTYLLADNEEAMEIPLGYERVALETNRFSLYRKKP